jgi:AcrR family transcriptional regulator
MSPAMEREDDITEEERARRMSSPAGRRLVAAMRHSVSRRGVNGSTFDRVAPEAGVSRGSIAWYCGTKERLLAEVMRADAEERLGRLHEHLEGATSVDDVVAATVRLLDDFLDPELGPSVLVHEMRTFGLRNGAIHAVQAELQARWRTAMVELLEVKSDEGVIDLSGDPEATAALFTAVGQGIAAEAMADPDWDRTETVRQAEVAARHLLGAPGAPQEG